MTSKEVIEKLSDPQAAVVRAMGSGSALRESSRYMGRYILSGNRSPKPSTIDALKSFRLLKLPKPDKSLRLRKPIRLSKLGAEVANAIQ